MLPGNRLGDRYDLAELLGTGPHTEVWHAHDRERDRPVRIKALDPAHSGDAAVRLRFRRTAMEVATLDLPGVVDVYECLDHRDDDGVLTVCQIAAPIDGEPLSRMLRQGLDLSTEEILSLVAAAAWAVEEAREAGVRHLNLKPGNVFVTGNAVTVADFGYLPVPEPGPYTSAELRLGGTGAERTADVYALAAIGYECLTGAPPTGTDPAAALPTETHPKLIGLLERALSADPDRRFGTAGALATECEQIVQTNDVLGAMLSRHQTHTEDAPAAPKATEPASEPLPTRKPIAGDLDVTQTIPRLPTTAGPDTADPDVTRPLTAAETPPNWPVTSGGTEPEPAARAADGPILGTGHGPAEPADDPRPETETTSPILGTGHDPAEPHPATETTSPILGTGHDPAEPHPATETTSPILGTGHGPAEPADDPRPETETTSPILGTGLGPAASPAGTVAYQRSDSDMSQPRRVTVSITNPQAAPDPVVRRPAAPESRTDRPRRNRPAVLAAIAVAIVAVVIVGVSMLFPDAPGGSAASEEGDGGYVEPSTSTLDATSQSSSKSTSPDDETSTAPSPTGSSSPSGSTSSRPGKTSEPDETSDAPDKVNVPDVVGDARADAVDELRAAKLEADVVKTGTGEFECPVYEQDPEGGSSVVEGTTVTIKVEMAAGEAECGSDGGDGGSTSPSSSRSEALPPSRYLPRH